MLVDYNNLSDIEKQICDLCQDWNWCDCYNCEFMKTEGKLSDGKT